MHFSHFSLACFIAACALCLPLSTSSVYAEENVSKEVLQIVKDKKPSVFLSYPILGKKNIDKDIRFFIDNQAAGYLQMANENYEAMDEAARKELKWEMKGDYSLSQPSENIVSIVFKIGSYSGGAHGNYNEFVLNFDLKNDRELQFQDLFEKPTVALELLSKFCSKALKKELGANADDDMIKDGTVPTLLNFENIQLAPKKVFIHFQPYQVAPWASGSPQVEVPLEELSAAKPESFVFGKY